MTEVAQVMALFAALLLGACLFIWAKVLRGPLLQRLDGGRASNAGPAKLASQGLVLAFGISAIAALLAVVGSIFA